MQQSVFLKIVLFFVIIVLMSKCASCFTPDPKIDTNQVINTNPVFSADQPKQVKSENWSYSDSVDSMTGKKTKTAMTISTNEVNFEFPYNGGAFASLYVRKDPRMGNAIIFKVSKGQISCPYDGCKILMRFEDQSPIYVRGRFPETHSSDTLFLGDYSTLLKKIKKNTGLLIEVPFYQNGNEQFHFDIENLDF